MSQVIGAGGIDANLSPDAFHRFATHYYKCRRDFKSVDGFSPVPYFLLCRAIELEIKARHLNHKRQPEVKTKYWHDLLKAYTALSEEGRVLNEGELRTLGVANKIYTGKGFEYFNPEDALTGYSRYPDLESLDSIAKKLIGI